MISCFSPYDNEGKGPRTELKDTVSPVPFLNYETRFEHCGFGLQSIEGTRTDDQIQDETAYRGTTVFFYQRNNSGPNQALV